MKMMITPSTNRRNPATWRWGRMLSTILLPIVVLLAGMEKASAYCTTGLGGASYAWISSVSITGTTLNNPSGMAATYYTAWPASGSTTATLLLGTTYTLVTTYDNSLGGAIASMWIDYNQNGTFEPSEWIQITTNSNNVSINFTVPATALPGTTVMRIRSRGTGNQNGSGDACTTFGSGETEDYTLTIASPVPCSGTPTPGTATASPASVCYNNSSIVSLTGSSIASGITYQWQSYNTGTSTWGNITGATSPNYSTGNLLVSTQYRCVLTCTNGTPSSATSAPVTVVVNNGVTPPYSEPFESITSNNALPNCMTATNVGTYVYTYTAPTGSWNQTNHTTGGSKFASFRYGCNDWLFSPGVNLVAGQLYQYSFWYITDGLAGWTTLIPQFGTSPTAAAMTNNIGSGVSNPTNTTYQQYVSTFTAPTTGVYYLSIWCQSTFNPWYLTVDDINVVALPPCSGQPTAGTVTPAGPISGCPGTTYYLTTNGTTTASGLSYQWYQQLNGTTGWQAVTGGTGNNSLYFTTPALSDTTKYRLVVKCLASGLVDSSAPVTINVPKVPYASLPFVEDFENWSTRCNTTDIPSLSWTNVPSTGDNSWRRDDQGSSANWTYPTSGFTPPYSVSGAHSARFAGYYATPGQNGDLDLYLNCSSVTGNKELQFFLKTQTGTPYPNDSLNVMLSVNGGATFTNIAQIGAGSGGWDLQTVPIVSDSPKTVIRFLAKDDYQYYGDIAIDYVRVLPPCSGKPTAGTVTPVTPCAGVDFPLTLQNNTQAAGLTYNWQYLNGTTWQNLSGGNTMIATGNISVPTTFRCIVTCSNSSLADTTPAYLVNLGAFYYCYCSSGASSTADDDIGNVTVNNYPANVTLMNNGTASPLTYNTASINTYSDFRMTVPPVVMYPDSVYKLLVTQINEYSFYNATVSAFVDFDHSGAFDPTEKVFTHTTSNTSSPANVVADTFSVPDASQFGITGMRVILVEGSGVSINPCGTYTWGETEDYLVNIKFPPCTGPTNAGTAISSDSSMCTGYSFLLTDTTHESHRSGISWSWQVTYNYGNTWDTLANSQGKDTLSVVFNGTSWYRLRMICGNTGDTTYSNIVKINIKPAYKCYCYSMATGGALDTSDIGSVAIGNFLMNTGGPHLRNPRAVRGRTDYTDAGPIELYSDSTYELDVYHIMDDTTHADARLTVFMDYNNNLVYDIPSERVPLTSDISTQNSWYMINHITIPTAVIPDVPTGMRLILNNNVGPNNPSDLACGAYTSGETEDYTVIFRRNPNSTGINNLNNVQNLGLYPNPTTGQFNISFTSSTGIKDLQITVTTLTGQQVMVQNYTDIGHNFNHEFDLNQQARGVYFVEILADGQRAIRKIVVR